MSTVVRIYYFLLCFIYKVILKKYIIAIKHPSPFKKQKKWGDYNVACDLANAINKRERYFALPVPYDFWYSNYNKFVDCTLLFRGLYEYKSYQYQKNFVFLISHIDEVKDTELKQYDKLFTSYKLKSSENDKYTYISEFTNTDFYYPIKSNRKKYQHDILFVGNSRNVYRDVVRYCVKNGLNISVYGSGWEKFIDKKYIKGHVINNEKVKYYYSNSKIILADHWKDKKELGSISNRIYNITACKGFCISDDVKGIDEVFEGNIPTFKTEEEFVNLINYYLKNDEERNIKAKKAYEITIQNYTAEIAANIIIGNIN